MVDIQVRDLTKTPDDIHFLDFYVMENEDWEKVKAYIEQLLKEKNK